MCVQQRHARWEQGVTRPGPFSQGWSPQKTATDLCQGKRGARRRASFVDELEAGRVAGGAGALHPAVGPPGTALGVHLLLGPSWRGLWAPTEGATAGTQPCRALRGSVTG